MFNFILDCYILVGKSKVLKKIYLGVNILKLNNYIERFSTTSFED